MIEKDLRIGIIRLSSLGDIIHTLPAVTQLRQILPNARISWIVEPAGARLLENFDCYDEIILFKLKTEKGLNKVSELRSLVKRYRYRFDVIFDFQGLIKSAVLSFLLKGLRYGFHRNNLKERVARFFYNRTMAPFDENRHVIFKNWKLVRSFLLEISSETGSKIQIGLVPPEEITPQYSLSQDHDSPAVEKFLTVNNLWKQNYLILNVGGGWDTKILSAEQYISLVRGIQNWIPVVLLWGNQKEKQLAERINRESDAVISEFFSFDDLIRLIRYAGILVTADTLALHLADVVGTSSVGIFGPSSPFRNGSLLKKSISVYENTECGFCYLKKCDKMYCLKNISIERIIRSIRKLNEKDY
jgi:heptosyltransferase-1